MGERNRTYSVIILFLLPLCLWGRDSVDSVNRLAADYVQASLVVCDPDDVLYSTLGHAALHLVCPTYDADLYFTYEGESVRNDVAKFLLGELKMGLFGIPPDVFLASYRERGRGVREYTLNLSPEQELQLWEILEQKAAEGLSEPYDYFHRGCAKAVVQVMHEVLGKDAIHYAPWSDKYTRQTQRELVRNFIDDAPWEEFLLYFLIGTEGDKPCPCLQKVIIPTDLVEVWRQATLPDGHSVLDATPRVILPSVRHNEPTWCTPLLVAVLLLVMALGSLATLCSANPAIRRAGTVADYILLAVQTLIGAFMTYLVCFSSLPCTEWNWLIIPFNILPALCWHWRRYWSVPYAAAVLIWCAVMTGQLLWGHVLADVPHIVLGAAVAVLMLKSCAKVAQR